MKIIFKTFNLNEFIDFKKESIKQYSLELIDSGKSTDINALNDATKEFDEILPQGFETENHYLYHIVNSKEENVGYIWFENKGDELFICDLFINERQRKKGYGKSALLELKKVRKIRGRINTPF